MTTPQEPRWYSVNNIGMATLCADKADAEDVASTCDIDFPRQSPHRAVQLVEVSGCRLGRDEILSMAREAEIGDSHGHFIRHELPNLERFAELLTRSERTARIEAQQRLADMQELAAKAGLAHMKAVQEAVREALQEARKACENLPAPDSCSGVERSLWDVATMACAEAVGKVGAT